LRVRTKTYSGGRGKASPPLSRSDQLEFKEILLNG